MIGRRIDRAFARYCRRRDPADLARVFDATASRLLALAAQLVGNEGDAEDVVQSTFVRIIEKVGTFDSNREFYPWASSILANEARMAWRKRRRVPVATECVDSIVPESAHRQTAQRESVEKLAAAIETLDLRYRPVIRMRLLQGASAPEIGRALGLSPETVRTRVRRGLERLRNRLSGSTAVVVGLAIAEPGIAGVRRVVLEAARAAVPSVPVPSSAVQPNRFRLSARTVLLGGISTLAAVALGVNLARPAESGPLDVLGAAVRSDSDGPAAEVVGEDVPRVDVGSADSTSGGTWAVRGTVSDERGVAIEGCRVVARVLHGCDVRVLPPVFTDRMGGYAIDVSALKARGDDGLLGASLLIDAYAADRVPAGGVLVDAMPRSCREPWSSVCDLTMARGDALRGRIVTPDGQPCDDLAFVRFVPGSRQDAPWVHTEHAGGEFVVPLGARRDGRLEVRCSRGIAIRELDLERGSRAIGDVCLVEHESLHARIETRDGRVVPFVDYALVHVSSESRSSFEVTDAGLRFADDVRGRADEHGRVRVAALRAGDYVLTVLDELGGAQTFHVSTDAPPPTLAIDGQVVELRVFGAGAEPLRGVPIDWQARFEGSLSGRSDIEDRRGRHHLLVPFGSRWSFAVAHWLLRSNRVVHVAAPEDGGFVELDVRADRVTDLGFLDLEVIDADGLPVRHGDVFLRDDRSCVVPDLALASFADVALPAGRYAVSVSPNDPATYSLPSTELEVVIEPTLRTRAVVELPRGARIAVTIHGVPGGVLAGDVCLEVLRGTAAQAGRVALRDADSGASVRIGNPADVARPLAPGACRVRVVGDGRTSAWHEVTLRASELVHLAVRLDR